MNERTTFIEMVTYGFRTLFWRPMHSLIFIAVYSVAMIAYYRWSASEAGVSFFADYADAIMGLSNGYGADNFFQFFGAILLVSLLIGTVFYAGVYRVLVREDAKPWLPIQLGLDELRLFMGLIALFVISMLVIFLISLVVVIASFVLTLGIAAVLGGNDPQAQGVIGTFVAFGLGVVGIIGAVLPTLYILGRLAVSLPLMIKLRRFTLGGWSASKGMGWSLLFAHLVVYLLAIGVQIIFARDVLMASWSMQADPGQFSEQFSQMMANPMGDLVYIGAPVYMLLYLLMLGPTAAIAAKAGATSSASDTPQDA
ncbi:MAG: hypothetical protein GYB36_07615 [Alphaproteobacteria bacterium]|nr:hypothetical protein [Alphaproteobacteria bacterium]